MDKNNKAGNKMTLSPKNAAEQKKLEAYLKRVGINFTVRGDGLGAPNKSGREVELEQKYMELTNSGRFRCFKDEKAAIAEGSLTRAEAIAKRIKAIEKENAKEKVVE